MKRERFKIKLLMAFVCLIGFNALKAQAISNCTINSPVCIGGTGSVTLTFTGAIYPFDLYYNVPGIEDGVVTITSSPQTIALQGKSTSVYDFGKGQYAYFYTTSPYKWFGEFAVGINYTQLTMTLITCTSNGSLDFGTISGAP